MHSASVYQYPPPPLLLFNFNVIYPVEKTPVTMALECPLVLAIINFSGLFPGRCAVCYCFGQLCQLIRRCFCCNLALRICVTVWIVDESRTFTIYFLSILCTSEVLGPKIFAESLSVLNLSKRTSEYVVQRTVKLPKVSTYFDHITIWTGWRVMKKMGQV